MRLTRLIRHAVNWHMALCLIALLGLGSCNETQEEPSETESEEEGSDEVADEPVWINAASLTCDWSRITNEGDAGISCAIRTEDGEVVRPPETADLAWDIQGDQHNSNAVATDKSLHEYLLEGPKIRGSKALVSITDGDKRASLTSEFDQLDGMDGELGDCLTSGRHPLNCFEDAGINIPVGDIVVDNSNTRKGCEDPSSLPDGVACRVDFDGMTDALVTIEDRNLINGDGLLKTDGTVDGSAFCDASGIVADSAIKPALYAPPLDVGSRPCFRNFRPGKVHDFNLKYVAFDDSDLVDGEPACFFMVIDEASILGPDFGGIARMVAIKNPKRFPDATLDEGITAAILESTGEHFSCHKFESD